MPFLDHGACLISGDVHSVEIGVAVKSLDLVALEFKLSPGLTFRLIVAISERNSEDTTSQTVGGLLLTGSFVARSQSDASLIETWGKDVVPLFSGEWMSTKILKR